jgi:predicted amidohydrolase YtcJ
MNPNHMLSGIGEGMKTEKANLVLRNGYVYTLDKNLHWAQTIAIHQGKIVFVGSNEGGEPFIGLETTIIDLDEKMVLPAFVDSHMHPAQSAHLYQFQLSLFDTTGSDPIQAYLETIRKFADTNPDTPWIIGGGYSRSVFDEIGPRKEWLDEIDSKRPIVLTSTDGHSMWVNSKALELAQITKDTPQPEEGVIKQDPQTGEPSGLLQEPGAMNLVGRLIPKPPKEQIKQALLWLQEWLNAKGITTVHEAMLGIDENHIYEAYDELARAGQLTLRYRASWNISPDGDVSTQIDRGKILAKRFTHPHFKAHSFKFFADHVTEEETGFLLEPYVHRDDGWYGIKVWDDDILRKAFFQVESAGYQIHVHVIGDAAARYTLDALETIHTENKKWEARHSFAHLQLSQPEDIQRMGKLGLSVHTSPYWMIIDDYFWKLNLPYLGHERAFQQQYPCNSLFKAGVNVTVASDFFVSEPNPLAAIYCGMTRRMPKPVFDQDYGGNPKYRRVSDPDAELNPGDLGVLPPADEKASLEDMLIASTLNGAWANFLEQDLGSIEVGKLADLVVLEQNLFDIEIEQIPSTQIKMTFFEGQLVYSRD